METQITLYVPNSAALGLEFWQPPPFQRREATEEPILAPLFSG